MLSHTLGAVTLASLKVCKRIKAHGWSVDTAAVFFGEPPHCIRLLMEGDIDHFSIDKLIAMVVKTGQRIKIEAVPLAFAAYHINRVSSSLTILTELN